MKKRSSRPRPAQQDDMEQRLIELARVTRVMAGGKRMRFRATLAVGDRKGRIGIGIAKGVDASIAIQKAFTKAKKNLITVPIVNETIPHDVYIKYGSAKLLFKPAKKGTGIKAGGAPRILLELAGVGNITGKVLGSSNKVNNVKATLLALTSFKKGYKTSAPKPAEQKQEDQKPAPATRAPRAAAEAPKTDATK